MGGKPALYLELAVKICIRENPEYAAYMYKGLCVMFLVIGVVVVGAMTWGVAYPRAALAWKPMGTKNIFS